MESEKAEITDSADNNSASKSSFESSDGSNSPHEDGWNDYNSRKLAQRTGDQTGDALSESPPGETVVTKLTDAETASPATDANSTEAKGAI